MAIIDEFFSYMYIIHHILYPIVDTIFYIINIFTIYILYIIYIMIFKLELSHIVSWGSQWMRYKYLKKLIIKTLKTSKLKKIKRKLKRHLTP